WSWRPRPCWRRAERRMWWMDGGSDERAERALRSLRFHAEHCGRLGSPLYAALLTAAAADLLAGGVVRRLLTGRRWPPGAALALRLTAALHQLVLEGRAPALAAYFPSVGGTGDPRLAWPAAAALLAGE